MLRGKLEGFPENNSKYFLPPENSWKDGSGGRD
jgi:hypothetical protein